MRENRGFSWI